MVNDFLEKYGMELLQAPPYSPDLAISDFFLFGYMKSLLKGTVFSSEEELKSAIDSILSNLDPSLLHRAFLNWKKRCVVVGKDGEYYEEKRK
jgi:histone-lysine N-methyltransferase SETMAR